MAKKIQLPALKVHQWHKEWDRVNFDPDQFQAEPKPFFLLSSIKAKDLKALTGVYRRSTKGKLARANDPNVQRGHEEGRSALIREYVQFGYPWCEMNASRRSSPGANDLRKPGWLPSSILVNVLPVGAARNGKKLASADAVEALTTTDQPSLCLPAAYRNGWEPTSIFPLEVIDGQHRLWAFDEFNPGDDFELPVVAFIDLDRSWQAYLFWSVNITPKRINKSLAFDLYPLLRRENWLERFAGHSIYRETRCQELVEALWSSELSPWSGRINMLGESTANREVPGPMVTQAAWIRSLMATFVKQWEGSGTKIGGVFGASGGEHQLLLPWNRPMQAALLIFAGNCLRESIASSRAKWAISLRSGYQGKLLDEEDPAFYGQHSLLTTDQGIRGFLFILNDLLYVSSDELELDKWTAEDVFAAISAKKAAATAATEEEHQRGAIKSLKKTEFAKFIASIADGLKDYDWRTSSAPGISAEDRLKQAVFRGSSGYKEMRLRLLGHLQQKSGSVAKAARVAMQWLGY